MAIVCPKCGRRGWVVRRRTSANVYRYVAHREGGRAWFCYLGPEVYKRGFSVGNLDRLAKHATRVVSAVARSCLEGAAPEGWCREARSTLAYLYWRIRWLAARDRDLEALLSQPPAGDPGEVEADERARRVGNLKRRLAIRLARRLRKLRPGGGLLVVHGKLVFERMFSRLVEESASEEEVEARAARILDAMPRYLEVVDKAWTIGALDYELRKGYGEALRIFKSLAPLSRELRRTDIQLKDVAEYVPEYYGSDALNPVYVGDWILTACGGELKGVDALVFRTSFLGFLARRGEELARYVDDEDRRRVFLELVGLARSLRILKLHILRRVCVRSGRVEFCDSGDARIGGGDRFSIEDPDRLPELLPALDDVERAADKLLAVYERAAENNREVLRRMREAARAYAAASTEEDEEDDADDAILAREVQRKLRPVLLLVLHALLPKIQAQQQTDMRA